MNDKKCNNFIIYCIAIPLITLLLLSNASFKQNNITYLINHKKMGITMILYTCMVLYFFYRVMSKYLYTQNYFKLSYFIFIGFVFLSLLSPYHSPGSFDSTLHVMLSIMTCIYYIRIITQLLKQISFINYQYFLVFSYQYFLLLSSCVGVFYLFGCINSFIQGLFIIGNSIFLYQIKTKL